MNHRFAFPTFVFLVFAGAVAPAFSQSQFSPRQFPGPIDNAGICTADFNGDGLADIAMADRYTHSFSVMFGQSDATFSACTTYVMSTSGGLASSICTGDFNNDNLPDLAVSEGYGTEVEVYLNNGGGTFTLAATHNVGLRPIRLFATNLDSLDNNVDIAVLCNDSTTPEVWVLRGDGGGGVLSSSQYAPYVPGSIFFTDMAIGDLDGDNIPDVAVTDAAGDNIAIGLNNGSGTFIHSQSLPMLTGSDPYAIAIGDVNNDGNGDLVVAHRGNYKLKMFLGNGSGVISTTPWFSLEDGTLQIAWRVMVDDYNGDGSNDVAVTFEGDVEVHLLLQSTPGTFGGYPYEPWLAASPFNCGFAFADFDGDGEKDIAIPSSGPAGVTYTRGLGNGTFFEFMNDDYASPTTCSSVISDFDQDGLADIVTCDELAGRILMSYGLNPGYGYLFVGDAPSMVGSPFHIEAGDFNADGAPDVVTCNYSGNTVGLMLNDNQGQGMLLSPSYTNVGNEPRYLSVGDLNLDGRPDVVAVNALDSTASVLLGDGAGGFTLGSTSSTDLEPFGCVLGDVNEDGAPDLLTANRTGSTMGVYLGLADGSFAPSTNYVVGSGAYAIALGDLNGDLHLDVAVVGNYDNSLMTFPGDGTGSYYYNNASTYVIGGFPTSVVIADVTGDAKADVVTVHHALDYRNVGVLPGDGLGALGTMTTYATRNRQSFNKMEVTVGDLNSDGQMDMVVAGGLFGPVFLNERQQPNGLALNSAGTAGCQGRLGLSATGEPKINSAPDFGFTVTNAPTRALGLGLVANAPDYTGIDLFGYDFIVHLDVFNATEILTFDFISDTTGGAFCAAAIPNDQNLVGLTYYLQTIWVSPYGSACQPSIFGLVSSRLLDITIQQ